MNLSMLFNGGIEYGMGMGFGNQESVRVLNFNRSTSATEVSSICVIILKAKMNATSQPLKIERENAIPVYISELAPANPSTNNPWGFHCKHDKLWNPENKPLGMASRK
ncbi:hypothetical protein SUGI_0118890 [Cryptomeria japonica]|nr:hypothetical protein SUGI_0118890 [Cryptomeria japonica]